MIKGVIQAARTGDLEAMVAPTLPLKLSTLSDQILVFNNIAVGWNMDLCGQPISFGPGHMHGTGNILVA